MEKDLADKVVTTPKQAKSLMSYVGYIIAAGVIGVTVILILLNAI
jgi:hypothetical protein